MSNLQTTNSSELALIAKQPGRLRFEFEHDPKSVVLKINDELHKASLVMGLNADAKILAVTALEVVKKIIDVYPHSPVEDIALAIRMASFGEIKLDNQLTTISASNIFNWYKQFRLEHSSKSTLPPPTPMHSLFTEPTEAEKLKLIRDSFFKFIKNPNFNDLSMDFQFQKLIDIGAFEPSTDEKRGYYFKEAIKMTQAPPIDFLKDREKRRDVFAYQDRFKEHKEGMVFTGLESNALHKYIIDQSKRKMVMDFLSMAEEEQLITLFELKYGKMD